MIILVAMRIVRAYSANNQFPTAGLPRLIEIVHGTLDGLQKPPRPMAAAMERPSPAAIHASVTPDALISFVDGRRYKTLKRHLSAHGLSPSAYRKRYDLPDTYPMVAQSYREERSRIARSIGLGQPRDRR
ncbi:MAG: MucR family transcriptional regulator [Methylobacterium organophilum]|nr:MucR family transcriptional regulator [Methylobacterium organophilum]